MDLHVLSCEIVFGWNIIFNSTEPMYQMNIFWNSTAFVYLFDQDNFCLDNNVNAMVRLPVRKWHFQDIVKLHVLEWHSVKIEVILFS